MELVAPLGFLVLMLTISWGLAYLMFGDVDDDE